MKKSAFIVLRKIYRAVVGLCQVLMKDIVTPVPLEEVRQVIKKCLENAALVNYTRISEYAKIEGEYVIGF